MPTSHVTMNIINFLIKFYYLSFKYLCVVHEGPTGGAHMGPDSRGVYFMM